MAFTLNGVALPYGLLWTNEHDWSPIEQSTDYGLTGAQIVQRGTKLTGRPMTLAGDTDRAWITQATLDALKALLPTASPMTVILPDGRTFSVIWDHNGPPISAKPLIPRWPGAGLKYGSVTLRMLTA